jgi:DNA-binding CsgD family transcriptional regulator
MRVLGNYFLRFFDYIPPLIILNAMRLIKSLLFSGVFTGQSEHIRKITILINIISLILLSTYVFSLAYYNLSLLNNLPLLLYTLFNSLVLSLVIMFNKMQKHLRAKHLFVFFLIEATVLMNIFFGIPALFNFVSVIVPLIIFNKRGTVIMYYILFAVLFAVTVWLQTVAGPYHTLSEGAFRMATYVFVFTTFFGTIYAFVYTYKHLNYRYEEQMMRDQDRLQQEYGQKTRQLTEKTVQMAQTSEFLEQIRIKLDLLLSGKEPMNKGIEDIKRSIGVFEKENIWNEFELHFNNVQPDFYKNLKNNYPDLSQAELKICALLRLNLNTKEMASITQKSVKSIEVARARIRKKMDLGREEGLFDKLSSFS